MKTIRRLVFCCVFLFLLCCLEVPRCWGAPLGTSAFTYQGRLTTAGGNLPAQGDFDLRFNLYTNPIGGTSTNVLTITNVAVGDGLFTTTLDFGPGIFDGTPYWLEVAVRPAQTTNFGAPLLPRQQIIGAPYALYAINAGVADSAGSAVTAAMATNATTAATAVTATRADSVAWTNIIGKPMAFNDDIDNDTTYAAGLGLILNGGVFSVDSSIARLNNVWQLGGNSNTIVGTHFLGTTDTNALEFKVNNARALRLEPHLNGANVIAGSDVNAVTGAGAASIGGGRENRVMANANYAIIPGGFGARARSYGQLTHAGGSFPSGFGEAQASVYTLRGTTTGPATNELFLDGSAARMIVPTNGVWTFDVLVVASTATNGQTAGFKAEGIIRNNGSAVSLVGTNQITAMPILATLPPAGWKLEITVPNVIDPADSESALIIRARVGPPPGPPGQVVRWVATVRTTELIHAP
jgi:hypothetical protein